MRGVIRMSLVLSVAMLVGFGCGKSTKVNLAGLQETPAGQVPVDESNGGGSPIHIGDTIEDTETVPVTRPVNPEDAAREAALRGQLPDPDAPAIGEWVSTKGGLDAALAGQSFVKNGSYWSDKVYFDFNRYEVLAKERAKLDSLAEHLRANPQFRVVIEGHCDERGSDEYNRALAERRSLSVQKYLVNLGIDAARMQTVSYGEDRPEVANASTEAEHQLNRRAEFLVGLP